MNLLLLGAIAMGSIVIAFFFFRFWQTTRDRFFLFFALSFAIEGINRAALAVTEHPNEGRPFFYFVRFLTFVLILIAIADKNFKSKKHR